MKKTLKLVLVPDPKGKIGRTLYKKLFLRKRNPIYDPPSLINYTLVAVEDREVQKGETYLGFGENRNYICEAHLVPVLESSKPILISSNKDLGIPTFSDEFFREYIELGEEEGIVSVSCNDEGKVLEKENGDICCKILKSTFKRKEVMDLIVKFGSDQNLKEDDCLKWMEDNLDL